MKAKVFQFGPFELDSAQQQLRRRGIRLKLPVSRFRLLLFFVARRGNLVTRDEIAACLWKDAQNVDVMSGINTAVNQLRAQLGDDPASPRYIETVIGAGYRFIASVSEIEVALPPEAAAIPEPEAAKLENVSFPPSDHDAGQPNRRRKTAIAAAAALVLCAPVVFYLIQASTSRRIMPQASIELVRATGSGDIHFADISPDGNYMAYVREAGGKQILWLKQLATGRLLQLATIGEDNCPGLAFSPDGNFVYFARKKPLEPSGELYRVPFLGGNPAKVIDGISGAPAISPDGKSVAFVRSTLETHGEDSIVTASIDGGGEQVLASYGAPGIHFDRVTWTLDGKKLIYPLQSSFMTIAADGGTAQALSVAHGLEIDDVRQLPQNQDLIVVGRLSGATNSQIFEIPMDGGAVRPITHDLSNYIEVRVTADGKTLLAVQGLILSRIQTLGPGNRSDVRSLSDEDRNQDGFEGLAWTPEGKILYSSDPGPRRELMEIDSSGSNLRRLAESASDSVFSDPAVSPRGDFIAVAKWFHEDSANIWRMNRNGGNERRLTNGRQDLHPTITPDGQWVVYSSVEGDQSVLMKVSTQGGPSTKLTDFDADFPAVSPDGKWIACSRIPRQSQPVSVVIVPLNGGSPVKVFPLPESASNGPSAWSPDGRAIAFVNNVNGVGNIWQQPVDGGKATPVTNLTSGSIFNFQWSRAGWLILSHGTQTFDAVLIRNFQPDGIHTR
jgi:Tol biopolymer transport system component/DNA-binding winged helix-turn-helix (wHTH) protein